MDLIPSKDGGDAPNGGLDPAKELFDTTIRLLGGAGVREREARTLTGKWRKEVGNDGTLLGIIASVSIKRPVDPVAYIQATIREAKPQPKPAGVW